MINVFGKLLRNWLTLTLWAISLASIVVMLKTTGDPGIDAFKGTWVARWLSPFPTGNQIGFDLSVGILVSVFFYLLVVALPARGKKARIKKHLLQQYDYFKRDCLLKIIWASKGEASNSEIDRLLDQEAFKLHFNAEIEPGLNRWHSVLNSLQAEPWRLVQLVEQLVILRAEIEFAFSVIEVTHPDALEFGRRLYQVLQHGSRWEAEYDDIKEVSGFFWTVFTGWDRVVGYTNKDHIAEFVHRL